MAIFLIYFKELWRRLFSPFQFYSPMLSDARHIDCCFNSCLSSHAFAASLALISKWAWVEYYPYYCSISIITLYFEALSLKYWLVFFTISRCRFNWLRHAVLLITALNAAQYVANWFYTVTPSKFSFAISGIYMIRMIMPFSVPSQFSPLWRILLTQLPRIFWLWYYYCTVSSLLPFVVFERRYFYEDTIDMPR